MANEAVKVELTNETGFPRRFTVASGTAIATGTFLALNSPRTAVAHSIAGQHMAGIASMDKSASDYSTSITVWTDGIFEMLASGAVTAGEAIMAGIALNSVSSCAVTAASGSAICGYAMEDIADGATGNIRIKL